MLSAGHLAIVGSPGFWWTTKTWGIFKLRGRNMRKHTLNYSTNMFGRGKTCFLTASVLGFLEKNDIWVCLKTGIILIIARLLTLILSKRRRKARQFVGQESSAF